MCPIKGQDQVVDHFEVVESRRQLKGPHHPHVDPFLRRQAGDVFPSVADGPLFRQVISGQKIKKGGFPGAIRSDNAGDFIFMQTIIDTVHSDHFAKPLGDIFSFDDFCT